MEKIETQKSPLDESNEKLRNALLKKYDLGAGLTNIPEETKIFSTIQDSKINNSTTKQSILLSSEKKNSILENSDYKNKTVNFCNELNDQNTSIIYKSIHNSSIFPTKNVSIDLKNSF